MLCLGALGLGSFLDLRQNIHCLTHKLIIRKYLEKNFNTCYRLEYNKLDFENKVLPNILYFASILFVYTQLFIFLAS